MSSNQDAKNEGSSGLSWGSTLVVLAIAILAAALIAYRMIYPFFHGRHH